MPKSVPTAGQILPVSPRVGTWGHIEERGDTYGDIGTHVGTCAGTWGHRDMRTGVGTGGCEDMYGDTGPGDLYGDVGML